LSVITAHGGVHPEGRYFQVVSDEGVLRVTAADLANALRNIGVVVLFVCSGGRADKHPAANTTLGLAKQIVDRGCSAVIASPWPLDARVPSHWLPTFLRRWTAGATLVEANFEANKIVDQRFSHDPARGLAMTVFGNPELTLVG
jgi:CHAT domain-containing protein